MTGAPAAEAGAKTGARRTVGGRLLVSFLVVLAAFALTLGWSLRALSESAEDARQVRDAYVPLLTIIGEALAGQNVMNAQLNHITSAKNPADVRQWIETARRVRPRTFAKLWDKAERGLGADDALRAEVIEEAKALDATLAGTGPQFSQLFLAIDKGDTKRAEQLRDELVLAETNAAKRLRALRQRVDEAMKYLTDAAERREERSIALLLGLSALTLLVGLVTSIYARRVLSPLGRVTSRARAVAGGDLTPREVVATDDEIGELASTFEDMVAAIRKARAELVQAERLATIGKMAAHITHEVRNPLSSISLNLELLEEELTDPGAEGEEARQLLKAIVGEVERLSQISEQYLAAVREPKLQLTVESIDDLVGETHAFVRPELTRAGLETRLEVEGERLSAEIDEGQLRQALLNLLRNAREAAGDGGEVILRVIEDGDDVEIAIEDDGPGIPDDVRASIFDPFYTTKRHGTGLGLAVTRSIVEAHGGTISCEPRVEGGTRFRLRLPRISE